MQHPEQEKSETDYIEDFKAKIDWSLAPKHARWWAVDANGQANWFCEPDVAARTDFWLSEPVRAPRFDFEGNWKKSLIERH
ncbi:MAG: hypothetical protein ABIS50_03850 [Luteolibacter sp.]|uniref:hypothetical protein n=1 Tax=Luteolibacter sp. TaxID=1962973 RepID=UPI0032642044